MDQTLTLTREPVPLFKVLKLQGLAESGGQAKLLIADGQVRVNGQVETRKARKMLIGDIIQIGDEMLRLVSPG